MRVENGLVYLKKRGKAEVTLCRADIVFLESSGHYITIHTENYETYTIRSTMKNVIDKLDKEHFMRIHRGIILNLDYVSQVNSFDVTLNSVWKSVPLSRRCKQELKDTVEQKSVQ